MIWSNRPDDTGHVTISLGVVVSQEPGPASPETIVALADQALYLAEDEERNVIRVVARVTLAGSTMAA